MKCYEHPEAEAVGTCTSCGRAICPDSTVEVGGKLLCKQCAQNLAGMGRLYQTPVEKKEPVLALLLSIFGGLVMGLLIGLGQIYNGQVKKGILLGILNVAIWFVVIIAYVVVGVATLGIGLVCCLPVLLVPLLTWLYAICDAYTTAEKINKGENVGDWLD